MIKKLLSSLSIGLLWASIATAAPMHMLGLAAGGGGCTAPEDITANTNLLVHSNNPDGSTNIVDSSPSAYPLTVNGNAHHESSVTSEVGGASMIDFDGTGDFVEVESYPTFGASDFTISIRLDADTVAGTIRYWPLSNWEAAGGTDREFSLSISTTDKFKFQARDASSEIITLEGTTTVVVDTEYWVVIERSGSNAYLYVNGSKEATDSSASGTIQNSGNNAVIGCYWASGAAACEDTATDKPFNGQVTELKIDLDSLYDGAATITEPTEAYSTTCHPLDGYSNQMKFSSDNTLVAATTTNIPTAVFIDGTSGIGSENTQGFLDDLCDTHDTSDGMFNLAITTDDEYTQTYVESVDIYCNAGSGEWAQIHFLAPSISSSADQDFYLYWDEDVPLNTEWVGSVNFNSTKSQAVWPDNVVVLHYIGASATANLDSSDQGNPIATSNGTPDYQQTAQLGYGVNFASASSERISVADAPELTFSDGSTTDEPFSLFGIINRDSDSTFMSIWQKRETNPNVEYQIHIPTNNQLIFWLEDETDPDKAVYAQAAALSGHFAGWHSYAGTYDGTSGIAAYNGMEIYADGSNVTNTQTWATDENYAAMHNTTAQSHSCISWGNTITYCDGLVDENYVFDKELTASEVAILHHSSFDSLFTFSTPTSDAVPLYKKIATDTIFVDQWEDVTSWTDNDAGSGVSQQETYQGFEVLSLDMVGTAGSDDARRVRDIGSIGVVDLVCTLRFYPVALDSGASDNNFRFIIDNGTTVRQYQWAADGMYVYTSGAWNEVGANINFVCSGASPTGCWQTWTIDLDETADTIDVYELEATGGRLLFDDHAQGGQAGSTDGNISFYADGNGTATEVKIDYFKCGSGFYNE